MQITTLLFIILLFANCQNASNNQKSLVNTSNDVLKLIEILSFNSIRNTSLLIEKDSVFFIIPDDVDHPFHYSVRSFSYDSTSKEFHFKIISNLKSKKEIDGNLLKSDQLPINIKSIGNFKIEYSNLSDDLKNKKALKEIINVNTKIHLYNGKYFFIDRLLPKSVYSYDPKTEKMTSFEIKEKFNEVTGYFLYDIDKDDNPEIFIFNIGSVPRDEVISYTIYSIREDSVKVEYK